MPPKKGPSKKTEEKKKQKVIEDKTFGLKNKKGAKNQKFIEQVKKQVIQGDKNSILAQKQRDEVNAKKEAAKKNIEELNEFFKPVVAAQKLAAGVDPKSVLCVYFKQGLCTRGNKCKFSHNLDIERKTVKRNIYEDEKEPEDEMQGWDQEKLEEVVEKKHGEKNKGLPPTQIICKFFLDAVENSKYGWFWECPNGEKCHYKHALPPGFMLKRNKKKLEEQKEVISLEELIENERMKLGTNLTPVTETTFKLWKRKKMQERAKESSDLKAKKQKNFKSGNYTEITGRECFEFNPDLVGEEAEGDTFDISREQDEDDANVKELAFDTYDDSPEIDEDLFVAEDLEDLDIEDKELGSEMPVL